MANPFTSGLKQSSNSATAPKNTINDPGKSHHLTHNTFNNSYHFYNTERFGDVVPFYVSEGVPSDKNPLRSTHTLKTFATESPLMTGISKKKGYFAVPYKAILPNNYDKVFVQPKKGDDVTSYVNTFFDLKPLFVQIKDACYNLPNFSVPTKTQDLTRIFKFVFALEMFFSHGSLLNILGYKISRRFYFDGYRFGSKAYSRYSFDWWFDNYFVDFLREFRISITIPSLSDDAADGMPVFRNWERDPDNLSVIPFGVKVSDHRFVELMRDNPDFEVSYFNGFDDQDKLSSLFSEIIEIPLSNVLITSYNDEVYPFNFARLAAYQITHRVFFTNDDVDNIYTANLYRQNLESIYDKILGYDIPYPTFLFNGVKTRYDILSGRVVQANILNFFLSAFEIFDGQSSYDDMFDYTYLFIHELFSIQKSLRFGDYFLGSRISPLAVGDVNAPVVANNVSAIDTTKSIQMQRFTNFVNKIPSQVSAYLREMFNINPAPDLTEPSYLAVTKSDITGFEVENTTSDNQGALVVNLISNDSNFAFEVDVDDPCIIVGVSWYEMPRIYTGTIERQMLHATRNDMFQPMLQYIGDQPIYGLEFDSRFTMTPFAYALRNMEYKQRFHQASGGFVESLKSWANVIDNDADDNVEIAIKHICPYLIRAKNYEFDRFFGSLTGFSLGTYFHFIVKYQNENNITRPMAVSPQILG